MAHKDNIQVSELLYKIKEARHRIATASDRLPMRVYVAGEVPDFKNDPYFKKGKAYLTKGTHEWFMYRQIILIEQELRELEYHQKRSHVGQIDEMEFRKTVAYIEAMMEDNNIGGRNGDKTA